MLCDDIFSQRTKATNRKKEQGRWIKPEKGWGEVSNIGGGLHKIGGVRNPLPTMF